MEESLTIAFQNHPFGVLAGFALLVLVFYFGMSLLYNGWPKLRK